MSDVLRQQQRLEAAALYRVQLAPTSTGSLVQSCWLFMVSRNCSRDSVSEGCVDPEVYTDRRPLPAAMIQY